MVQLANVRPNQRSSFVDQENGAECKVFFLCDVAALQFAHVLVRLAITLFLPFDFHLCQSGTLFHEAMVSLAKVFVGGDVVGDEDDAVSVNIKIPIDDKGQVNQLEQTEGGNVTNKVTVGLHASA